MYGYFDAQKLPHASNIFGQVDVHEPYDDNANGDDFVAFRLCTAMKSTTLSTNTSNNLSI